MIAVTENRLYRLWRCVRSQQADPCAIVEVLICRLMLKSESRSLSWARPKPTKLSSSCKATRDVSQRRLNLHCVHFRMLDSLQSPAIQRKRISLLLARSRRANPNRFTIARWGTPCISSIPHWFWAFTAVTMKWQRKFSPIRSRFSQAKRSMTGLVMAATFGRTVPSVRWIGRRIARGAAQYQSPQLWEP